MPRYRVSSGDVYNIPQEEVDGFLLEFPGAELIEEEIIEEAGKPVAVAGEVATVTAESPEATGDLELYSGELSLEQEGYDPDYISTGEKVKSAIDAFESTGFIPIGSGFLTDKAAKFVGAASDLLSGVPKLGRAFSETLAVTYAELFEPELVDTVEKRKALAETIGNMSIPGQVGPADIEGVFENISAFVEDLETTGEDYEQSISENLKEGDLGVALDQIIGGVVEAAPSVGAAFLGPGGLALIGTSSAGNHYDEIAELNPEKIGAGLLGTSIVQGGVELLSETVTRGIGGRAMKLFKEGNKIAGKEAVKSVARNIARDAFYEGSSEVAANEINNLIDQTINDVDRFYTPDGEFDMTSLLRRSFDTFLISSIVGGGITGGAQLTARQKQLAHERLTPEGLKRENKEIASQINKLHVANKELKNETVTNTIKTLEEQIAVNKAYAGEVLDSMTQEDQVTYARNAAEIADARQQIKNQELSEVAKSELESIIKVKEDVNNKIFADTAKAWEAKQKAIAGDSIESQVKAIEDISGIEATVYQNDKEIANKYLKRLQFLQDQGADFDFKEGESINDLVENLQKGRGTILQYTDANGNFMQEIFVNKEKSVAAWDKAVGSHEILHGVLAKAIGTDKQVFKDLTTKIKEYVSKNNPEIIDRIEADLEDKGYSEEVKAEEFINALSDLMVNNKLTYTKTLGETIRTYVNRLLKPILGDNTFKSGKSAYAFIKDYSRAMKKGQLTKAAQNYLTSDKAITPDESIVREARSDEASQRVQQIYDQQGEAGAFDIIEQFKPITSKLVERRREAPGFDRQLLTDEIETGQRGIIDLIKEYNPESGVPLAAYINKFLPARAIEASKRVLGEEFTEDVSEARGVAAEEVTVTETPTKPEAKAIDPFRIMPDVKETATAEVQKSIADKNIDVTEVTYKELKDVAPYQTVADFFNIPVSRIKNPKDNLRKSDDVANIQRWILKNEPTLKNLFTEANREVVEIKEGNRVARKGGEPTAIPRNLLNKFYTKGERVGNNFQWTLKPYNRTTFLEAVGIKDGKVDPNFTPRAAEAQTIKGILDMYTRNLGNVAARDIIEGREDIAPAEKARAKAEVAKGKPRLMFSKNIDTNIEDNRFSQIYFAYERGEALANKDKQIVEDYISKQAIEESDKGKSALQFTKAMKVSDLPSNLKEGTWTLSDKKFKEDASALKEFNNQADNLSSQIPLTASIANKNRNIVLGLFAGHYNIVGSDMAKIGSDFKQGILNNLNTDESSVLSKETLDRWEKFPWDNLKSSYASENYTGLRKINESNSFKEQQAIARETFNNKQGKASLELYDLWNTTLQEWLYSSEPGSKEFNDKANYILKLKKSNASIGTTGERILAPPGYVFLPGQAISGTVKFEHLKSSSQQSGESALLVLQNKWKDKGKDNIKAYNGIWGLLDDFNIIDEQTGKVNDSSIFRFAENLELAKSIYSVESNFTKTLYDDIVKKVGEKSVKKFESDQNKLFNFNNNKLPVTVKLSKSKTTPDVLETMESLDSKAKEANKNLFDSADLNKGFNDILEQTTGIASEKRYKRVKAEVAGAARGRVFRGIPYSAQDFVGLLYETLSKGKLGDAQMAWYQENLLKPYAKAMNEVDASRLSMMQDYRALKKELELVPKNLRKKIPGEPFTREQAVRVYIWNQQGMEVPGISESDLKDLTDYVNGDRELQLFANQLIAIQKGDEYAKPKEGWPAGTITTDLLENINTVKRAKYLEQWKANRDIIFSEENLNKLEAAYGKKYRKAMENMLGRMETGRNRSFSDDSLTGRFTDWLQGSVGAIMFFNTRSALLQTISAINFVNFTDNNPFAAAKAFANQKQYWSDFTKLINSDFLKARRSGLRMNVNEADIADMAKKGGPKAVINKLLQLGFAPTQIADSFAIASGGATFYRNRVKTYTKQGLSQQEAETRAFEDFRENAEESQQSARPDRISMQQAGGLGRLILAFQNTPSQYARIIDKSIRDLKNGRGDAKTNISKIIYYSTVQNLLFNAIQQALFAFGFDDEEPEDEKKKEKYFDIANGMSDSLLRGTGLAGGVLSVTKNAIIRIVEESEKDRPKFEKVGADLLKIAPPVSSKLSKINQAARSYQWDKEEMKEKGWSLDNPAYLAAANVISATTNIPVDRGIKKINNVVSATNSDLETWERLALLGGWQDWEIGIDEEDKINKPQPTKQSKQVDKTKPVKF